MKSIPAIIDHEEHVNGYICRGNLEREGAGAIRIHCNRKRGQLFKIDYVPGDKDRFYLRGKTWLSLNQGYAVASGATPVGFFKQCYCFSEEGLGVGWTHIFSPTVVRS